MVANHRPWFKVAINTILRLFQPRYAKYKFLMYSNIPDNKCIGYGFGWIEHNYQGLDDDT